MEYEKGSEIKAWEFIKIIEEGGVAYSGDKFYKFKDSSLMFIEEGTNNFNDWGFSHLGLEQALGRKCHEAIEKKPELKFPHPNSLWKENKYDYSICLIQEISFGASETKDKETIKIANKWCTLKSFYNEFTCVFDGHKFLNEEIGAKFDMGEK